MQVLSATGVVSFVTVLLVAELIAGCDHHVVRVAGAVFDKIQHRPPEATEQSVALARVHVPGPDPGMVGRQPFVGTVRVIGKEIRCLLAVRRADANLLAATDIEGPAFARRNDMRGHDTLAVCLVDIELSSHAPSYVRPGDAGRKNT